MLEPDKQQWEPGKQQHSLQVRMHALLRSSCTAFMHSRIEAGRDGSARQDWPALPASTCAWESSHNRPSTAVSQIADEVKPGQAMMVSPASFHLCLGRLLPRGMQWLWGTCSCREHKQPRCIAQPCKLHLCLRQLLLQAVHCLLRGLQPPSQLLVGSIPLAEHLLVLLLRCRLGVRQTVLSSRQGALQSGDLGLGRSQFMLQLCTVLFGLRGLLLGCPGSLQHRRTTLSACTVRSPLGLPWQPAALHHNVVSQFALALKAALQQGRGTLHLSHMVNRRAASEAGWALKSWRRWLQHICRRNRKHQDCAALPQASLASRVLRYSTSTFTFDHQCTSSELTSSISPNTAMV